MLMMIEKGIRGGICRAIYRYAEANNKYMENYSKNIKLLYLKYLDANNLNGQAIFQKSPVNGFKWKKNVTKFHEKFIKNCDKDNNKGYILKVHVEYSKHIHSNLPFLSERMKIKKCNKLVCNLYDKKEIMFI